jgi:1-deoxy-D-xylulose-5-phosphate synthase
MFRSCLEAAELLAAEGIEATVWDPRVVKPLDGAMLDEASGFDVVVTAEDGLCEGGIGDAIAHAVADRTLSTGRNPRVRVLGVPVEYVPHGKPDDILADLGLDASGIAAATRATLSR